MNDITDGQSGDEPIGHIKREQILTCWAEHNMRLGEIAQATELDVRVVRRELRQMQKQLVESEGSE